jgi:hypothetical protein
MPLDFPDSPSIDDTFTTESGRVWVWDGSRWESMGVISSGGDGGSGSITVSETAPEDANEGDLWFNSVDTNTYIYYDSFWVQASDSQAGPAGPAGPTGSSGVAFAVSPITYDAETNTIGINQSEVEIGSNQIVATTSDKSVNYTIQGLDKNTYIRSTGTEITITVPDVLQDGESVNFIQAGSGQITFLGSGITILSKDSKLKTAAQYSGATVAKVGGAYYLIGDLGA